MSMKAGNQRKVSVGIPPNENQNFLTRRGGGLKKPRVFVGMSGGVDSSVSAALLKDRGYDVTGVFIKVWQPDWFEPARQGLSSKATAGVCTWKEDRLDAMRVAAKLGIPFVTLDLEKEYKQEVVDYMIAEYKAGRTPNPDVMCNRHVKFGAFFDWAMEQGADYVATGHYARVEPTREFSMLNDQFLKKDLKHLDIENSLKIENCKLKISKDLNKDQSYFLWTLTQRELAKTLFPVGHLEKQAVRKLAEKFELSTAAKKDSQGLCFIGKVDMKDFLLRYIVAKEGDVLNENGDTIGRHKGAVLYTLGERHGFTITKKTPNDQPYFVVSKDIENNTITVSSKREAGSLLHAKKEVVLSTINWINEAPQMNKLYGVRIRYRQPLQKARIENKESGAQIFFEQEQSAVTPGQSAVIYDGEVCMGGGIIER